MIYFLPERIYQYIKKNNITDALDKLTDISNKFNTFSTFKEYIQFLSLIIDYDNHKEEFNKIDTSIRNAIKDKPILLQEFDIISQPNISKDYIHDTKALDDENYLVMLLTFIDFNDPNKKDVYFSYMKTFINYFESHESKDYSKYIYFKLLTDSISNDFITNSMSEEDITSKCMNTIKRYYNKTLEYSSDKDNINSQFCDWVCFFIHNIKYIENI